MDLLNLFWQRFVDLRAWQMVLWGVYFLYFLVMTYVYYEESRDHGVVEGYKVTIFRRDTHFRLYHIIRIIWELPMAIVGLMLPSIKETLTFRLYEFKKSK